MCLIYHPHTLYTTPSVHTSPYHTHSSSYLHWKLLFGWLAIILLDSLADFRFEYLYPVIMFLRSVYDSYKYQGLVCLGSIRPASPCNSCILVS